MRIYKQSPYYCEQTGHYLGEKCIATGEKFCDYTGIRFEDDPEISQAYTVSINHDFSSESDWDSDDIAGLKKYFKGDDFHWNNELNQIKACLFEGEYHFLASDYGYQDNLGVLMLDWISAIKEKNKKSPYYLCSHFASVLRMCRYNTLLKLLKNKKTTMETVGLLAD